MTPELLPMLKPFAQAVAAQRERVPMTAKEADALEGAAKIRGWWISGLTRSALIKEAHERATAAIANGLTREEFLELLGATLDKQDGLLLSPKRLELIAQNNLAIAYASGRRAQMLALSGDRPYWQYPLGPNDDKTSEICRKLEAFVARHDDPVWNHIYPPNHHNERHLQVLTLTEEQAREAGIYESPSEGEYPQIDGQTILPDPGWDFAPDLLVTDGSATAGAIRAAAQEPSFAKSAADYGLSAIADVDLAALPSAPAVVGQTIDDIHDEAQYERAWDSFRAAVGMNEGTSERFVVNARGEVIRINRATFEHMMGLDETDPEKSDRARTEKRDRALWFGRIVPTLEDPFETWMQERDAQVHLGYVGIFRGEDRATGYLVYASVAEDGWLIDMETGFKRTAKRIEAKRRGRLVQSKARKG